MNKFALVAVVGIALFVAAPASADAPPATIVPATPVVVTGTADMFTPTTPVRNGLFSRIRARRNGNVMMSTPLPMTGTVVPQTVTPSTPVPSPMPRTTTVTPASGTVTGAPVVSPAVYTTPAPRTGLFGRLRNRNNTTTAPLMVPTAPAPLPMTLPMGVIPASGTVAAAPAMPADMVMMTNTTATSRMGLFARLRARR